MQSYTVQIISKTVWSDDVASVMEIKAVTSQPQDAAVHTPKVGQSEGVTVMISSAPVEYNSPLVPLS